MPFGEQARRPVDGGRAGDVRALLEQRPVGEVSGGQRAQHGGDHEAVEHEGDGEGIVIGDPRTCRELARRDRVQAEQDDGDAAERREICGFVEDQVDPPSQAAAGTFTYFVRMVSAGGANVTIGVAAGSPPPQAAKTSVLNRTHAPGRGTARRRRVWWT